MSLDQKRARIFGVLYLITYVTSISALLLYEPALRHPVAFVVTQVRAHHTLLCPREPRRTAGQPESPNGRALNGQEFIVVISPTHVIEA